MYSKYKNVFKMHFYLFSYRNIHPCVQRQINTKGHYNTDHNNKTFGKNLHVITVKNG